MSVYFADLRAAAEPATRAAVAMYESANEHTTVTSQVSGFPSSQGTRLVLLLLYTDNLKTIY